MINISITQTDKGNKTVDEFDRRPFRSTKAVLPAACRIQIGGIRFEDPGRQRAVTTCCHPGAIKALGYLSANLSFKPPVLPGTLFLFFSSTDPPCSHRLPKLYWALSSYADSSSVTFTVRSEAAFSLKCNICNLLTGTVTRFFGI